MSAPSVPIAIIGMSCRFAGGATDPEKLWQLCAEGRTGWSEIPEDRFNIDGHYHPRPDNLNTTNVKGACFLDEDVGNFDATFFNLPAETAACLDPQFRLMLEGTYEAFENAGLTMADVNGSNTSVYAGSFFKDYHDAGLRDVTTLPRFFLVGVGSAMASNRLSHYFDLRGASMSIDTGCSTTLTALHQACNDLRNNESNMSVVSGANLMLNPDMFITMSSIALISKDGRSFAFDSRANGYGRGEGVATIVLKRLDDAIRDGDPIQAVIKGSGLNQDGKTDTITTPSQEAQIALMQRVYKQAGLDPGETTLFEAHGTGTPTGDPLEVGAIAAVFKGSRSFDKPLPIGSIKPNVGHTECASGLASIVKVVKSLEKGLIAPAANLEIINPKLKLAEWNLRIPRTVEPWNETVRRASVNNFGYGGANSHVILENYIPPIVSSNSGATSLGSKVYILSAKDEHAAKAMVSNLRDHILELPDNVAFQNDLAYTLGQRRSNFPWVASTSASSLSELVRLIDGGKMKPRRKNDTPRLGFVFTGQGAQWWAMGRELISSYPVFRETLHEAEDYLREFGATYSLMEELYQGEKTTRVNEAALGQPVCVAVQIALVRLLESWGVKPTAVTSHSSGEIASAYAAGVLSLRSAMGVVYARGTLAADVGSYSTLGPGGMMAVGLGVEDAEKYIARVSAGRILVACRNSPTSVTISGDVAGIEEMELLLQTDKIFARKLQVPTGYHSHHMEPIAKPYAEWLHANIKPEPQMNGVIYSSPTTGHRMTAVEEIGSPDHWVKSLTQPVLFVESFTNMCFASPGETSDVDMVIELGAHPALSGPIQDIKSLEVFAGTSVSYGSCLVRKKNAVETMQALACELIHNGFALDMGGVNLTRQGRVLTDLPKYAWNHQIRHWYEPRMNRAHRMLSDGSHDLLGSLVTGTNRINPSWRHVIKPSSMPWIRDHMLQGTTVYPGAGFICMAIEGLVQAEQNNGKITTGYRLRDIDMLAALVIPEGEDGVEVQLSLKSCSDKAIYAKGWKEFQVFSVTHDDKWSEHCRGLVCMEYEPRNVPSLPVAIREATEYRVRVSPSDVYDSMHRVGIQHGPIFQNLKAVRTRTQGSLATIATVDTAAGMPYQFEHSHVIHPTTLDTVFQAIYAALPAAGANLPSAQVPRSIKNLWISDSIKHGPANAFHAFSEVRDNDKQGFKAAVTVMDDEKENVVITIEDFLFQSIGSALGNKEPCENDKFLLSKWVPDITLMQPALLKQQLVCEPDLVEAQALADLKLVCAWYLKDALAAMTPTDVQNLQGHFKRYYSWMKLQVANSKAIPATQEEKAALTAKIGARSVNGELVCNLGPHLVDIICGRISPLDLMQEHQLLYRFYAEGLKLERSRKQMAQLVRLFALKNPRAKMLEIGAGSGGATHHVLNALGVDDPLSASYDFTDVAETFFEAAEEDFQAWKNLVSFKKLDIEQDPAAQGFEAGSYDLVLASQVLHRTRSMDDTVANVRKLLKPGGKLVIMESTKDQLDFRMAFGLLPDQWLGEEEHRLLTPSLTVEMWIDVLQKNGFIGADIEVHDCESDELYSYSVIMSSADAPAPSYHLDVVIAVPTPSPPQAWLNSMSDSVVAITGATPNIQPYDNLDCEGKIVVFLAEVSASILSNPSDTEFEAIRNICTRCKGILWVTRGGAVDSTNPLSSLPQGFLRILRLEYVGKLLGTLDLDPGEDAWSSSSVLAIANVYATLFANATENKPRDFEFAERNGVVNILRYFKDHERNKTWFPDTAEANTTVLQKFVDTTPLHLAVENPGHLDSLIFVPDPNYAEMDISADELEISPKAFGITARDVSVATNALQDRHLGFECAGVVTRLGTTASDEGFQIGDRVAVLLNGECGNLVRVPWTSAVRIPAAMGFELAAALPVAYATAWISLMETARLEKGDSVLVHDAGSAVGQAAISLAKYAGAEVFATVSNAEHGSFLRRVTGISSDRIFPTTDSSFAAGVRSKTNGRGVDVVLNTLEGALLQETLNCVAPLGHFIELGKRDLEQNSRLDMGAFARSVTFSAIDAAMWAERKGRQVSRALRSVLDLMKARKIRGVSISVHDISDVVQAFRNAQSSSSPGTVVLSVKPDSMVPVIRQTPTVKLHADASYVVVGGFGGIGQSICLWLAEHGAKSLIVLSRSANAAEKAAPLLAELEKLGCMVKPVSCDIADEADVMRAVEACKSNAPIRGVIQGAMVLRDSILEQMTLSDYTIGLRPKVQGTWNLHQAFASTPLDFFVILSSIAGVIGIASQCNYGAGGAFQDALAAYRTSRGLPCVSIDIGAVKNVGYVAEHEETDAYLKKQGHMVLSEGDVLKSLACAITSPFSTQLVFGINTAPSSALWDEGPAARDLRFWPAKFRNTGEEASSGMADTLAGRIACSKTLEEAAAWVGVEITAKIMDIFMIPEDEVFPNKPMADFGVDSLTAVELRNALATKASAEVSIFDIMQSPSLIALATSIATKSAHLSPALAAAA
ncbi:ketoacyl-synt-domain-containing protein [Melanomma pulvis-pyrius CBS 109.77]|uniref:Ketoacyl-synt-domain-containing protein n=1 Tax=Melanomma pulvis-pyrius CBS 109.77 TaxID=1314802 RepID=A0A6A6XVG2_9PLEO|nr:ketoacyl-synt-domain-containing protein [Melanomma pulvis-pyrius CBS 109.77]